MRPRMRARDYRPDMGPKYDWSRGGSPLVGQASRTMGWFIIAGAVTECPVLLWEAVTQDWTLVFAALIIAAGAFVYRLALRKTYGVRS